MDLLKRTCPIAAILALTSCYEDFAPNVDSEPVLCINSLITAGEIMNINVTHTWRYDRPEDSAVDDATVTIYVNGEVKDWKYKPKEGDKISIKAYSPTYGHAEADVTVPASIPAKEFACTPVLTNLWQTEMPDYYVVANLHFDIDALIEVTDAANSTDYYRFSYGAPSQFNYDYTSSQLQPIVLYAGSLEYQSEPIFSEHIGIFESIMGADATGFAFFTDRQFSGATYPLRIHIHGSWIDINATEEEYNNAINHLAIEFTISTISESYYSWLSYNWQISNSFMGDLGELGFGEPLHGYSNVSTGAGVVAAQAKAKYKFYLKDFIENNIFER